MSKRTVVSLYKKYVQSTEEKAIVQLVQILLCHLTTAVAKGIGSDCTRVYITTRVIKHTYDKKPAEEFEFLIKNVRLIVEYPNIVYRNKNGKRGAYCFVKQIGNFKYLCSLEITTKEDQATACEVVTFFRIRNENYLKNYEPLWEWKVGDPSS